MDTVIDLSDADQALNLANIRFQLIRLEDTITFHLIERVQFPLNATIYKGPTAGGVQIPYSPLSLVDWLLREQERLESRIRRFEAPDEHPFFPDSLEKPILAPLEYPRVLHANTVNANPEIKKCYIEKVLPAACRKVSGGKGNEDRGETQENYGSAATCDVKVLQALSRRIHFGKFVAEAKFRKETERFVKLIKDEDKVGIDEAITDAKVEQMVLERLRLKARTYGTDPSKLAAAAAVPEGERLEKIDVEAVVAMYKDVVIPLTKVVEVEYLMQRLKGTEWE